METGKRSSIEKKVPMWQSERDWVWITVRGTLGETEKPKDQQKHKIRQKTITNWGDGDRTFMGDVLNLNMEG
jgi:hypothetical protein